MLEGNLKKQEMRMVITCYAYVTAFLGQLRLKSSEKLICQKATWTEAQYAAWEKQQAN